MSIANRVSPATIVDAVWLALTVQLFALVAVHGVNLPYMDEWEMIGGLANAVPLRRWLFAWHNEHLLTLPNFLYWLAFQITHDLRAGMVLSVALWSALSRLLVVAARRARGRPALADALFPLLLLHAGQHENVLMSYQIGYALAALLAGTSVVAIGGPPTARRVIAAAACGVALPLCGGPGLLFSLPGAGWLAVVAVAGALGRGNVGRRTAVRAAVGVLTWAAVASLYVWLPGKPPSPAYIPPRTAVGVLAGTVGFGAAGYGPAGEGLWPLAAVVPVAVGLAAIVTVWRSRGELCGPRWVEYVGAAAAVAGGTALAAAVAWGRTPFGLWAVFAPRYGGLSALNAAAVALFWVRFPPRVDWPALLTVVALAALPLNFVAGWRAAAVHAAIQRGVLADVTAGVPVEVVGRKYNFLTFIDPARLAQLIEGHAALNLGPFTTVAHEGETRTVPLPPPRVVGDEFVFELDHPQFVNAVVVRGQYLTGGMRPITAVVAVRSEAGSPEIVHRVPVFPLPTAAGDPALIAWVAGPVAAVRVVPDAAGEWQFRVTGAELQTPLQSTAKAVQFSP